MKRAVGSGPLQPTKVAHLSELALATEADAFQQRFSDPVRSARRRCRFHSLPRVVLSEEVADPLPTTRSLLDPEPDNDFVPLLGSYCDSVVVATEATQRAAVRTAYIYQVLNHVLKTQALIESGKESRPRDQGFTQATVLILLPYKRFVLEVVEAMIRLHCKGRVKRVYKKSRQKFENEYTNAEDLQYGDDFKLGLTLAPRHHMFLYTPFKHSDVIIASPLALSALLTETPAEASCLASIEVMIVDEAGIMHMQNWDHLELVCSHINLMPSRDFVTADIERVREYWLDERGAEYRQTIVLSEILTPAVNALISRSKNRLGNMRIVPAYSGVLASGVVHRFRRFECDPATVNEERFNYFTQEFWPKMREQLPDGGVVFCSSYYEFVRLKNWFDCEEPGIVAVSEYTSKSERQRNIAYVESRKSKAVLLTERLVYFRHVHVKNAAVLVFYSLPLHPQVYTELTNHVAAKEAWCVFSLLDALHLQRLLGDEKAKALVESRGTNFAVNASS